MIKSTTFMIVRMVDATSVVGKSRSSITGNSGAGDAGRLITPILRQMEARIE